MYANNQFNKFQIARTSSSGFSKYNISNKMKKFCLILTFVSFVSLEVITKPISPKLDSKCLTSEDSIIVKWEDMDPNNILEMFLAIIEPKNGTGSYQYIHKPKLQVIFNDLSPDEEYIVYVISGEGNFNERSDPVHIKCKTHPSPVTLMGYDTTPLITDYSDETSAPSKFSAYTGPFSSEKSFNRVVWRTKMRFIMFIISISAVVIGLASIFIYYFCCKDLFRKLFRKDNTDNKHQEKGPESEHLDQNLIEMT